MSVQCPVCKCRLNLTFSIRNFASSEVGRVAILAVRCPRHWPKRHVRLRSMPLSLYLTCKDLPEFPEFLALAARSACLPGAPLGAWMTI
jgi:hypothetical protein